MKIGIMGTGGVGGYFGGLLARAGADVHFVARGKHLQAIQEEGLQVASNQGSFRVLVHATSEPFEIGPVDLLLFCVKSYDTLDAARASEPLVEEDTVILTLQNGIDNVDKLSELFGVERIMGGTTYIESTLASSGVIVHTGKPGRIVFGELFGEMTERARRILELFLQAGIPAELSSNIQEVLWSKFLFICGVHGVSTLSRSSLGQILSCNDTRDLMVGVMEEVLETARKQGLALNGNVIAEAVALAESYNKRFKCSMLRDLEWRRPMEIDSLNGMVVQLGCEIGLPTPLNHVIYACLKLENQKILDPFRSQALED
jgi:2-dehydropantoate 2-reductase